MRAPLPVAYRRTRRRCATASAIISNLDSAMPQNDAVKSRNTSMNAVQQYSRGHLNTSSLRHQGAVETGGDTTQQAVSRHDNNYDQQRTLAGADRCACTSIRHLATHNKTDTTSALQHRVVQPS